MAHAQTTATLTLTSPAFQAGGAIPGKYTCNGEDVSPPLAWEGTPNGTRGLALIVDDPDAPGKTWVHWVLFNVPPGTTRLDEAVPTNDRLSNGAAQGQNDFGKSGYGGPCPPKGSHRYFFRLYALDRSLDLPSPVTKKDLLKAMQGHVLARGELMGTYSQGR